MRYSGSWGAQNWRRRASVRKSWRWTTSRAAANPGAGSTRSHKSSASGTGDIVLRVLNRQSATEPRKIAASDISPQMLAIAKRRIERVSQRVELRLLDAHSMPDIPAGSVDLYSISLGLKICNRAAVLREALRVLKPGGRLIVLEASLAS
jgi:ubiquinone/menaquinone biosynthesis C-methylase UbiE